MSTEVKREELSEDQLLDLHREEWLSKIFNYELFNKHSFEETEKAMKAIYKYCGLEEPKVVLMGSPMGCQQYLNRVMRERDPKHKDQYFEFSTYVNYSDFGWLAFYDYFIRYKDEAKEHKDDVNMVIHAVDNCFMSIQMDEVCVVSKYPSFISRNANNETHNIDGPAIKFEDGFELYYINGLCVEEDFFNSLLNKTFTFEDFLKESNEEIKSAALAFFQEKYGDEYVFQFISKNMKEVDTYVDKKDPKYLEGTTKSMNIGVYTLFKGVLNGFEIGYVRCYCPSTDRMFFLGIDAEAVSNAKDAIASLYRVPRKLAEHIKSISRQGEVFSTVFTPEGLKIKDTLTEADIQDQVSVTGNEYFSKMSYEF